MAGNQNPLDQINRLKPEGSMPSGQLDPGSEPKTESNQETEETLAPPSSIAVLKETSIGNGEPSAVTSEEIIKPVEKPTESPERIPPASTLSETKPVVSDKAPTTTASEPSGENYNSQPQAGVIPSRYSVFHNKADHSDAESVAEHEPKANG